MTEIIRTWAATAAAGAATGFGLTKRASAELQVLGLIAGGIVGGVAGRFIKVEVPIYRLSDGQYGQWMWVAVAPGTAAPVGLSLT